MKIEDIEKRFVFGDIDAELYHKYIGGLKEERSVLTQKLEEEPLDISNLEITLSKASELSRNLHVMWDLAEFDEKGKIQNLLFPDGIEYIFKNGSFRTKRVDSIFNVINYLSNTYNNSKIKKPAVETAGLPVVHSQGFEPRTS